MTDRSGRRRRTEPPPRVLTDPKAIRALAHPARLAVLETLGDHDEMTATALAQLADITPSAMSYHLRALEKWGFVERAESGDARERPWRRVTGAWRIDALPAGPGAEATRAVSQLTIDRASADLQEWFVHEHEQSPEWRGAALLDNRFAWLTADEAQELRALYEKFFDERKGRTARDHPEDARRVRLLRILAPTEFE